MLKGRIAWSRCAAPGVAEAARPNAPAAAAAARMVRRLGSEMLSMATLLGLAFLNAVDFRRHSLVERTGRPHSSLWCSAALKRNWRDAGRRPGAPCECAQPNE